MKIRHFEILKMTIFLIFFENIKKLVRMLQILYLNGLKMIKLTFKLIKTGQKHIYEQNSAGVILTPPPPLVNNGCKKAQGPEG